MKKITKTFAALAAALGCICCAGNGAKALDSKEAIEEAFAAIDKDTTLTDEQKEEKCLEILNQVYDAHSGDSLGLLAFTNLMYEWDCNTLEAKYEKAGELIRNNEKINHVIEVRKTEANTAPGHKYIDVEGPDAITGKTLSISGMLPADKPLIVDFWASWCPPCKREIKEGLIDFAKTGKAAILGIAVWEQSEKDTRDAMEQLGITWPVIYAGSRTNSPTEAYGITGIPTMLLIAPDGTILARSHQLSDLIKEL